MQPHRLRRAHSALLALTALTLAACGSDSTGTKTTTGGSIGISLSNAALNITQGTSATATITVSRTTFTGAVTLSATGLPSGVTAANVTIGSSDTQGTLSLTATSAATVGVATVTIHATGSGVSEATTTLSLTVVASGTGATDGFSLAVTSAAFSVAAGASGNTTINITRTGSFTGAVNLTATTPTGVTASFAPASVSGTTSTLTLTVGASVGAGPLTVTVLGNATGLAQQSATITLTVTAGGGGGGAGSVVYSFCSQSGIPVFLAMQDGAGAWTAVTAASNAYTFSITSGKGGVAYVVPSAAGGFDTEVFFGTTSELQARGVNVCNGTVGTGKTVTGTVSGTSIGDQVFVTLGRSQAIPTNSSFTLNNVLSGSLDLIASRSSLNLATQSFVPSGIVIQRGLNVANNGSVGAVNFASAVVPASAQITANNLGTDNLIVGTSLVTANNTSAVLYSNSVSAAATQTWYGLPTASEVAGDIHLLSIIASAISGPVTQARQVLFASTAVTARTVTIGAALAAPTVSVSATVPYVRLRIDHTVQSDYTQFFVGSFQQAAGTTLERLGGLSMTAGYAGSNTISLVLPDLSAATGWNNNFGLKTGAATHWTLTSFGWTSGNFLSANPYTDGATFLSGTQSGTITP